MGADYSHQELEEFKVVFARRLRGFGVAFVLYVSLLGGWLLYTWESRGRSILPDRIYDWFALLSLAFGIPAAFCRCPACNSWLHKQYMSRFCPSCGIPLR